MFLSVCCGLVSLFLALPFFWPHDQDLGLVVAMPCAALLLALLSGWLYNLALNIYRPGPPNDS
jgi:hypothetical protein